MLTRVVQFKTSDGTVHDSKRSANNHEAKIEAKAELHRVLLVSLSTGRAGAVTEQILDSVEVLLPLLVTYKKKVKKTVDKTE